MIWAYGEKVVFLQPILGARAPSPATVTGEDARVPRQSDEIAMRANTILLIWWLAVLAAHAGTVVESELAFRRFTTHDGLPQMQTERVWQDARGYIYIGTLSGFARYDGRTLTPLLRGRRNNIVAFAETADGVWAMGFRRKWRVADDKVEMSQIDPSRQWLLNNLNAMDLPGGYVLLEDEHEANRRLCLMDADAIAADIVVADTLLDMMTPDRKMFVDATGIYIPTEQGLFVADSRKGGTVMAVGSSAGEDVMALCRCGSNLYALASDGIYTVDTIGRRTVPLLGYDGFKPDFGLTARATADGQMLIADAHAVYRFDGRAIEKLAGGFNLVRDMLVDRWNRLWVATYEGLYCFFNRRFVNHRLTDGDDLPRALALTADGTLVMGTLNGKLIVGDDVVSDQPDNYFVPSSAVIDSCVYMACRGDVACVGPDRQLTWLHLPYERYQFVSQHEGRLVLGTRQMVVAYDPKTRLTDTLTTEIPHPWCAVGDADGNLWVGSTFGLFCLAKTASGLQSSPTTAQGMDVPEGATALKPTVTAMARTQGGDIYFACEDSLFLLHKGSAVPLNDRLPQLCGHEIRALHVAQKGALVIAVIDGLFVARLDDHGGICFDQVVFVDHNTGFSLLEPQQSAMAEGADGTVWLAGLESAVSFRPTEVLADRLADTFVAPPMKWWQHWWAIALMALVALAALVLLTWTIVQKRNRYVMQKLAREKKLKELQISAIRLKAIPHFHSNVLAGIEYFLMNDQTTEAIHYLKLYSDFTNQTLADIDRPARSVEEELEYTRKYLELEQLRYGERLRYSISIDSSADIHAMVPTMLLHTYCQNAVKHGIGNKVEGGDIDIAVAHSEGNTIVSVKDNGVGRQAAAALNTNSNRKGLEILLEQIALYNQTNRRHIVQTVDDLKDEQGRPSGTRFVMTIPDGYEFIGSTRSRAGRTIFSQS